MEKKFTATFASSYFEKGLFLKIKLFKKSEITKQFHFKVYDYTSTVTR